MLMKLLAVLAGTGPMGIADLGHNAVPPNADQFYESCWSALGPSRADTSTPAGQLDPAVRMHAICDAVYAESTGHASPTALNTHFAHEIETSLAALPPAEHAAYIVDECKQVVGGRQDICTKIEYHLNASNGR
jgi:hypothetical protein